MKYFTSPHRQLPLKLTAFMATILNV
jgi:hypothetical protein